MNFNQKIKVAKALKTIKKCCSCYVFCIHCPLFDTKENRCMVSPQNAPSPRAWDIDVDFEVKVR